VGDLHQNFYNTLLVECSPDCCPHCCAGAKIEPSVGEEDEETAPTLDDSQLCPTNRMTPQRPNLALELYKQLVVGFSVRTRQWIPMGTFAGEFVGELCTEDEAVQRKKTEDYSYLVQSPEEEGTGSGQHYVDPSHQGNITRFFNHSCFPNLIPIRYLSAHRYAKRASIGFVAVSWDFRQVEWSGI
jgi:SET domain